MGQRGRGSGLQVQLLCWLTAQPTRAPLEALTRQRERGDAGERLGRVGRLLTLLELLGGGDHLLQRGLVHARAAGLRRGGGEEERESGGRGVGARTVEAESRRAPAPS